MNSTRIRNPFRPVRRLARPGGAALALGSALAIIGLGLLATPPLEAQDTADLRFGWGSGAAQVTMTSNMAQQVMGMSNTMESTASYRMTVAPSDGGLLVSYSDFVFDGTALDDLMEGSGGNPEEMSQAMGNMQPDILVSSEGEYLGMANFEEVQAAMREMMAPMVAEMQAQGMGGMFEDMMESTLSRDTWDGTAAMGWNQMVGYWAGRSMSVGEGVSLSTEMPIPLVSNQTAPVELTLEYAGSASCSEGGAGQDCVRLVATATPNSDAVRELMDVFMADMMSAAGGSGVEVGITALEITTVTTLIADPGTLKPFRMESVNKSTVAMDMMGMQQTTQNDQTTTLVFDWGN